MYVFLCNVGTYILIRCMYAYLCVYAYMHACVSIRALRVAEFFYPYPTRTRDCFCYPFLPVPAGTPVTRSYL